MYEDYENVQKFEPLGTPVNVGEAQHVLLGYEFGGLFHTLNHLNRQSST